MELLFLDLSMPMPCTCFISYPHVDSEFFVDFVEELRMLANSARRSCE